PRGRSRTRGCDAMGSRAAGFAGELKVFVAAADEGEGDYEHRNVEQSHLVSVEDVPSVHELTRRQRLVERHPVHLVEVARKPLLVRKADSVDPTVEGPSDARRRINHDPRGPAQKERLAKRREVLPEEKRLAEDKEPAPEEERVDEE